MKLNDFLKTLGLSLQVDLTEDLTKLDIELPETFDTKFTQTYLTRDRAKSDDEIISEITKKSNKKAFNEIDEQIKELLPFVSSDAKQKIDSVFSTPEKLKLLKPALDEALKGAKGKLTPDDIRKVEDEWSGKYKALQEQSKADMANAARQMEDKNFEFYITNKLSGYTVAKEFTPMREQLNQMALMDLKNKGYTYEFENGNVAVRQVKDGVPRDVFDGENKITIEKLLDKFINPFIPKSNGGTTTSTETAQRTMQQLSVNGKETLAELMQKERAGMG